jgi:hypothetical protein
MTGVFGVCQIQLQTGDFLYELQFLYQLDIFASSEMSLLLSDIFNTNASLSVTKLH